MKQAFTLIELLVVITIVTVLFALSVPYYTLFTDEKVLEDEAGKILDIVNLTQKKAVAADLGTFSCPTNFNGYRFTLDSANTYSVRVCCGTVGTCDADNTAVNTYTVRETIQLSGTSPVTFYKLSSGATAGTLVVRHTRLLKCIAISVSATGVIEMGNKYSC